MQLRRTDLQLSNQLAQLRSLVICDKAGDRHQLSRRVLDLMGMAMVYEHQILKADEVMRAENVRFSWEVSPE